MPASLNLPCVSDVVTAAGAPESVPQRSHETPSLIGVRAVVGAKTLTLYSGSVPAGS